MRVPLSILVMLSLVLAACSSDDGASDDAGFGQGPPSTEAGSTTVDAPTTTAPPDTTSPGDTTTADDTAVPPDTTAAPPTTAAPAGTAPATTVAGPLPEPAVELTPVGQFDQPVGITSRPGDETLYVIEQPGRIVASGAESTDVVLDMTDLTAARGERGLLGLAFHPDDDLAYVHHTDDDGDTVVAEYAVDAATRRFDPASRRVVLTVDQPFGNHNGGRLTFGPDGMLYIGLGDGGSADDPQRTALDLSRRLGKILRLDPTPADGQPFTVPDDNPFVDTDGADPTIWSFGLRNPWRFSFDDATGDLWIADVGQNEWEEIDHAPADAGAGRATNFGWSAFEGFERFNTDQPETVAGIPHTPPRFVYDHSGGRCSVSGGAVSRGDLVPGLQGWYVFGDYCSGEIWGLDTTSAAETPRTVPLAQLDVVVAVHEGPFGDLYAVSNAGTVARFTPA